MDAFVPLDSVFPFLCLLAVSLAMVLIRDDPYDSSYWTITEIGRKALEEWKKQKCA